MASQVSNGLSNYIHEVAEMHVRFMPLSDGGGSLKVKYRSVYNISR